MKNLKQRLQDIRPAVSSNHATNNTFVFKDLDTAKQDFLRIDCQRRMLQSPYDGPFNVVSRSTKTITVLVNGAESSQHR